MSQKLLSHLRRLTHGCGWSFQSVGEIEKWIQLGEKGGEGEAAISFRGVPQY